MLAPVDFLRNPAFAVYITDSTKILLATRDAILINEFQLPPFKNHRNFYCNHDR